MPARLARGVIAPKHRYVCLSCRLQKLSIAGGHITRYQHTGPPANAPANVGGDGNQEFSLKKDLGNDNGSTTRSRIREIIRSVMFKPDGKDQETKGDSRVESLRKNEQSPPVPESIPSTAPKPKDSADVLQRKLQQKFATQRRKDLLTMQAKQASKVEEDIKDAPKAHSVPKTAKQGPKKSSTRAERSERKRKIQVEKAALGKKATKRSKLRQAKPVAVVQNEVAEVATSTKPQTAEELPTSVEASAGKIQEASGSEEKKAKDNDNAGNVSGKQTATAKKLDDIMDILESSKNPKKPGKSARVARRIKSSSTQTTIKRVVVAVLNELKNRGDPLDTKSRKAGAMISQYSSQLLARMKEDSEKTSGSLDQSNSQILLEKALRDDDSLVRNIIENRSPSSSTQAQQNKHPAMLRLRKHVVHEPDVCVPGSKSLRAALGQNSGKVKSADPKSIQLSPSERIEKALAPPEGPFGKASTSKKSPVSLAEKAIKSKRSPQSSIETANASDLEILPVTVDQPPVPMLAYGLERVLFNPGVYQLQDMRSRVYNFDPYLQKIMPIAEFDFNALKEYITSSRDESLNKIAQANGKRYMGSTSSMTEVLAHFHFLLSQWRPINTSMLSKAFPAHLKTFTEFQRIPSAIFLRWKDGSYAIDADKQFASASVLSMLGKSMEKLLTLSTDNFERYRKSHPGQVTEDERYAPESYHYSTLGDFLMRSQLDAHDSRLPGTGMFDLKTRSVVSIRMDVLNYEHGIGYEIKNRHGDWESYEREYYDMIRAAFLKYSLQVRMGRMDGIFVAYHNIERIFGFQYISLPEMDATLHGQHDTSVGDQEFRLSLDLMNKVLDRATQKYPETSLRIFFETRDAQTPFMYIFAEPVTEEQVVEIQSQNSAKIQEFERNILGLTRGNDFEMDDAQEVDPKWEKIQADVQKAMEKDELSVDGSGQDQEPIDVDAEGTESALDRPEVFERGPLYVSKSKAGADEDAFAASAGNEDDGDSEDDDDINSEDEREENEEEEEEEEEKEEGEDGDAKENRQIEESRQQEGLVECLDVKSDINAIGAVESQPKLSGDNVEGTSFAQSESHPITVQNDTNLLTKEHGMAKTSGATSGRESIDEPKEPANLEGNTVIPPDAKPSSVAEAEGQQENQIQADQSFLDSISQDIVHADTFAESPPPKDVLAMTLTLRNKVNGEYVLRPEKMTPADEWSIEYSLIDVPETARARALYQACQRRRKKKMETPLVPEDAEVVSAYIQKLRELSLKGRRWRKKQDGADKKRPVQVL